MAHKMGTGSTSNGRDSNAQRRGIKAFGGEKVIAGSIIVRQCGTKFKPGFGVGLGKDGGDGLGKKVRVIVRRNYDRDGKRIGGLRPGRCGLVQRAEDSSGKRGSRHAFSSGRW